MNPGEAKALARGLFLKALPHLAVGPRMKQMVRLRDGVLEIARDRIRLPPGRPVRVVAMGKAAIEMTHTLAEILPHVPLRGVVAAPALPKLPLPGFEYFAGGHPYPNEESWRAAEAALALLANGHLTQDDLVIFLISGGGSALFEMPWEPSVAAGVAPGDAIPRIALQQVRQFYELLVTGGMNIREMNTLRKRFSAVKGGRLAVAAWPARQMTLYVSDVPGQASSLVASGPTCPDDSNWGDCNDILSRYDLWGKLPASYRTLWEYGKAEETPKPGDRCFARSAYFCLLSNTDAVEQLAELTEAAGIVAEIDTRCDDWPYQNAADYLLARAAQLRRDNPGKPVAIISGGELSCPVTGDGVGGRNQAFVLECVKRIAGTSITVLSAGTDGVDGNSTAAGAVADGQTLERARALGLDPDDFQRRSDSYHFFEKLGDTIVTGPTGTNVRDLRMILAAPDIAPRGDSFSASSS